MITCTKICRSLAYFCLLIVLPFTRCDRIHERMSDDEIIRVFRTTRDAVPDYKIVSISHSLYKRSATTSDFHLKITTFSSELDLYMTPIEGFLIGEKTPVWYAQTEAGKPVYKRMKEGILKSVLGIFQNVSGRAGIVVLGDRAKDLQFYGTIDDLILSPLPDSLHPHYVRGTNRHRRNASTSTDHTLITRRDHVIFKINGATEAEDLIQKTIHHVEKSLKPTPDSRSKRSDDDNKVIFPTVLVTTDFNRASKPYEDNKFYNEIIYQLAFWNAVDLRFRHLSNPKVRLRIAGFVIGTDREATPYLRHCSIMSCTEVNVFSALNDMQKYWYSLKDTNDFPLDAYHVVMTATDLLFSSLDTVRGWKWQNGISSFEPHCDETTGDKKRPVALYHDDFGFGGVNTAVHELAHVLGASHDNGAPGGGCEAADGYLMAPILSVTSNSPKWSECSKKQLSKLLSGTKCYDKPREHYPTGPALGKIFPASLMTAHEQCQARGYDWACTPTEKICKTLRCYAIGTLGLCRNTGSAAEGTPCAVGKACFDGECKTKFDEPLGMNTDRRNCIQSILLNICV